MSVAVTSRDDDTPGAAFCSMFSVRLNKVQPADCCFTIILSTLLEDRTLKLCAYIFAKMMIPLLLRCLSTHLRYVCVSVCTSQFFFPSLREASITKTYCSDELLVWQCVFSLLDSLRQFQYISVTVFDHAFDNSRYMRFECCDQLNVILKLEF